MLKKGFTLIEIIIAIFVITVGVLAAYIVTQEIISYTYQVSSRLTAVYLAKEGIEIVRNIRDTNWIQEVDWKEGLKQSQCDCYASENKYCEIDYNDIDTMTRCEIRLNQGDIFFPLRINGGFYSYGSGSETKFYRKIAITPGTNLKVVVSVWWGEGGKTVTVQEILYNWY